MAKSKQASSKDRFLPCLLDRLTDDKPHMKTEARNAYKTFSLQQLKKAILRDLIDLLNSKLKMRAETLKSFHELCSSVINYGLEGICGKSYYSANLKQMESDIRQTIIQFEPRINKENLKVTVKWHDNDQTRSSFIVEIRGIINVYPLTEELLVHSELDVETGNFIAKEK